MGKWRKVTTDWLSREEHEADGGLDASFAQVLEALSIVQPSGNFVERTVAEAWRARRRQRLRTGAAGVAAIALLVAGVGVIGYGLVSITGVWLLTNLTAALTGVVVSALTTAATAAEVWWAAARTAGTVTDIVATPQGTATLVTLALIGAGALYLLQRLLTGNLKARNPVALFV